MRRCLLAIFILLLAFSVAASELEPKTIGPTAGNVSFVSTAYAGGKFLTVWRQLFMPSVGIWGAFSDGSGKPLAPSFAIVPSTNAQYLNVFPRGDGFVLVWDDANRSSQLCQIDGNGRATGQTTIGPPGLMRAYATQDRIAVARYSGSTIVDFDGGPIAEIVEPGFIAAGRNSFLAVTNKAVGASSKLLLTRYSADGQFQQESVLMADACRTLFGCWFVAAVRELDSGSVLVVLANSDRSIQTLMVAQDGSVSAPHEIAMTLPALWRATIQPSGGHLWLFLAGGGFDQTTRVEATELDSTGAASAPFTTIVQKLAGMHELLAFAEGTGLVLGATSPTTADRQVQTFAFRGFSPVAPDVVSTTASIQADAQIASNGSGFLAVWKDTNETRGSRSHWAAVNAAGQRTSPIFEGDGDVVRGSLVSNGLDYLVLLLSSNHLIARRLASDGTLLGDTMIPDAAVRVGYAATAPAAAVATSNGYVIVWSGNDTAMHSAVLTSNGVPGPAQTITPSVPSLPDRTIRFWTSPVLAWDGSAILLTAAYEQDVFSIEPAPPDAILSPYAMLLTSGGLLESGSETPIDPAFSAPTAAASSGSEFLVAGSEFALIHRDATRLRVSYPIHNAYNAHVVWNGSAYVAARSIQGSAMVTLVARDGSIVATTFRRGPRISTHPPTLPAGSFSPDLSRTAVVRSVPSRTPHQNYSRC
jgi:hypothetical protein